MRIEELDGELVFLNRTVLANELIETLLIYNTFAGSIDIEARVVARRGLAQGQRESNRFPVDSRAEHKVQISRVKSIDDGAVGCAQPRMFFADGPLSGQPHSLRRGAPIDV